MSEVQIAKDRLIDDTRAVIEDAEALLRATKDQAGEQIVALRARVERNLTDARASLAELKASAMEGAITAGRTTNAYVYAYPWQSVGIAAGFGLIVGMLVSRR